jgi:predicted dehydrogenase
MNPEAMRVVAFSEIRPSNQRLGWQALRSTFGEEASAIELVEDCQRLLAREDVELVIIAVPPVAHAALAVEALERGKHVFCEKVMATSVRDAKRMARAARAAGRLLAVGYQRHYSHLYASALELVRRRDLVGEVRHIRAFWHRNLTGGGEPGAETGTHDNWKTPLPAEDGAVDWARHGYQSLDELVNWRLYRRTGGGLVNELASHQMDACAILVAGLMEAARPVYPAAVSGVGASAYFVDGREVEDHVFLTLEYPRGLVVSYSAISTNELDSYGELVLGTRATLAVQGEENLYVCNERSGRETRISWNEQRISQPAAATGPLLVEEPGGVRNSRGYREQQEHLAWLIRNPGFGEPRVNGELALANTVVALAASQAMRERRRIELRPEWFDVNSDEAPGS